MMVCIRLVKGNNVLRLILLTESGGWMDHVTPYHAPKGTAGEWMEDPYGLFGDVFAGPGNYQGKE